MAFCGDFKMISFFRILQGGYTKHFCYISTLPQTILASKRAHTECKMPVPGRIKPGHVIQIVIALKEGDSFKYISKMFSHLSKAKDEGGIFCMLQSYEFEKTHTFLWE